MIRRILVATDFSPQSEAAVRQAIELAQALEAEVTLFHSWFAPVYGLPDGSAIVPDAETVAQLASSASQQLDAWRARVARPGVRLSTRVAEGAPAEAITGVAQAEHFDLIVIGTHGRTGVRRLLLGSVAERVVRSSQVPVMTVHSAPDAP
jgi:nucleotide-binding universal stress UspA family protein